MKKLASIILHWHDHPPYLSQVISQKDEALDFDVMRTTCHEKDGCGSKKGAFMLKI